MTILEPSVAFNINLCVFGLYLRVNLEKAGFSMSISMALLVNYCQVLAITCPFGFLPTFGAYTSGSITWLIDFINIGILIINYLTIIFFTVIISNQYFIMSHILEESREIGIEEKL